MISRDNLDYAKSLIESNRNEYPYYILVSNTNISDTYDYQSPSYKVYFSRKPIIADGRYNFTIQDTAICYSVITSNASKQYHSARVKTSEYSGQLSINDYEFCYTNAEFKTGSIQPDLLATSNVTSSHFDSVSLIILVVLLSAVVFRLIRG